MTVAPVLLGVGRPLVPTAPRPAPEAFEVSVGQHTDAPGLQDLPFEFESAVINRIAATALHANVRELRRLAPRQILVEGHTDEWGTEDYNRRLGARRAEVVRGALIRLGLDRSAIVVMSYGKSRPRCQEHHRVCWAENRRVHFRVSMEGTSVQGVAVP
jgi:outer membrane protein OmpA-like peptidoglycan-associated protein